MDTSSENGSSQCTVTVPESADGERLDRFLPGALEAAGHSLSRSAVQGLIKDGAALVNGKKVKPRHAVAVGDVVVVSFPEARSEKPEAEDIEITVLYEDDDIIVVNKQTGLVVHPASGNLDGTLVNALLHHCDGKLCELAGDDRPGIVHRLDKDTSGCLVAAKTETAYHSLVAQFSGRETGKEYLAITNGVPTQQQGTIENRIGRHPVNRQKMAVLEAPAGKEAVTDFEVIRQDEGGKWAAVKCVIHTGRTHQIRVHLKECLHAAILGDPIYGQPSRQKVKVGRLLLHARRLRFRHPVTAEMVEFEAEVPEEFEPFL
ncbi:MAG: RNA pseudouridine synthase [Verrucomicrobiales bacterium]|nr:RNA pseudouridine synthase [Verrucomicrobiales bacterium]